jgi:hypothetical protein
MTVLRRRSILPAALPRDGEEPPVTTPVQKAGRRTQLGKKPVIPILSGPIDKTDYREVVRRYQEKVRNPRTAIRAKCVECSGGSLKEVQLCRVVDCALYPFRMGLNPFNKKTQRRLARESGGLFDDQTEYDEDDEEGDNDEGDDDES